MMKNCLVGQSGGPTAAINATLCGVIKGAKASGDIQKIYGCVNGIYGFLHENLLDLSEKFQNDAALETLRVTPAAYLGSCRYKLPKDDLTVYRQIFDLFQAYEIGYFFYIGGNDSMDTVDKLSKYAAQHGHDVNIIGIPKTIDNDLAATDHTPGFGSAAKYVATTIIEITHDSEVYDTDSVTIVEIMGRSAGWLTAASALASQACGAPHLIYLPERNFDLDRFLDDVKRVNQTHKNVIVAISEGIHDKGGNYICESVSSGLADTFGHKYLSGAGKVLEAAVRERLGFKARAVELNVSQRCAAHLASKTDIDESEQIGMAAVHACLAGETGKMMVFRRQSSSPYQIKIESHEIGAIANAVKVVPDEMIREDGSFVTQAFVDYAKPLIQGETNLTYREGLPLYLKRP